jgi:hypothetical protein
MLAVVFTEILSPAFSLILGSIVIGNKGNISTTTVMARSGSIDDLQAAINAVHAQGGGTVFIPAGTFPFDPNGTLVGPDGRPCGVKSYGGINIIGAGSGQTILNETKDVPYSPSNIAMITVDGLNELPFRISGIRFQGFVTNESTGNTGLTVFGASDYRIDNCWFDSFTGQGVQAVNGGVNGVNRGVIDHCNFTNSYKLKTPPSGGWLWGYGIIVWNLYDLAWSNITTLLGRYYGAHDIAYVENCWFDRCRHAISESQNGYYVIRYCNITNEVPPNFGSIDVHGFNFGRGCEVYNNTVTATSGYGAAQAVWLRGGTSTVFNNTFVNCLYGVMLFSESDLQHQVQNTYIWGNTMVGGGTAFADQSNGAYTQNVTYFLYERPGYTPFTYPHPITL